MWQAKELDDGRQVEFHENIDDGCELAFDLRN